MELNYKVFGEGKDLIVLHGLFGSLDNWVTLGKKWSENYRVWLVDQRNHGKSPHSEEFSYQAMADDLLHFMKKHQIEKAMILGHSMGGKTAMEFAIHHEEMIYKLIVVDIAPVKYRVHHYKVIQALNAVDVSSLNSRSQADEIMQEYLPEFGVRQFLLKNLDRKSDGSYDWKFNLKVLEEQILPISEWAISEGKYEKDVLFIKGELSEYILPEYASEISQKFPSYDLEIISNAGHWVHAEKPAEFFEVASHFMKD